MECSDLLSSAITEQDGKAIRCQDSTDAVKPSDIAAICLRAWSSVRAVRNLDPMNLVEPEGLIRK
jgi:hypothetical protein